MYHRVRGHLCRRGADMTNAKRKSKLTDAERHKRFVAMTREVGASEDAKDFEKVFKKVVQPRP